mgnify:CR=1 FL=1
MKRYAIWNKRDPILTPIGEVLTAEEWIDRYPIAGMRLGHSCLRRRGDQRRVFRHSGQMVQMYEAQGADFSGCETAEDKLAVIEAFEDERNKPSTEPTVEERTAAAWSFSPCLVCRMRRCEEERP